MCAQVLKSVYSAISVLLIKLGVGQYIENINQSANKYEGKCHNIQNQGRFLIHKACMQGKKKLHSEKQSLLTKVGDSFVLYVNLICIYKIETKCLQMMNYLASSTSICVAELDKCVPSPLPCNKLQARKKKLH